MAIKIEEFLLPAHWASYLINGDATGYGDAELAEIDEWETMNAPGPCIGCADFVDFCWGGDDGLVGAERTTFTFQVLDAHAAYSDGEVVAWM